MGNLTMLLDSASSWIESVSTTLSNWNLNIIGGIDFGFEPKANLLSKLLMIIFEWMGSYGWTIILFTLALRLITLPLDFWQKFSTKKNSRTMEEISDILAKIDKTYGNDPNNARVANAEKQKIMKKYGYSPFAMCLPTIVTMVVFIVMFQGLNNCSNALNVMVYQKLQQEYLISYQAELNTHEGDLYNNLSVFEFVQKSKEGATQEEKQWVEALSQDDKSGLTNLYAQIQRDAAKQAQQKVIISYEQNREGFLWIKSLWRGDSWDKVMPKNKDQFTKGLSGNSGIDGLTTEGIYNKIAQALTNPQDYFDVSIPEQQQALLDAEKAIGYGEGRWNGLLILPVLAIGLSFVTTWVGNKMQGKVGTGQQEATAKQQQKFMMYLMPIMMGMFSLFNTAAFALYLVASSVFSLLLNLIENPIVNKMVARRKSVVKKEASYKR